MIGGLFRLARPLIHKLDPEEAHNLTVKALSFAPPFTGGNDSPELAVSAMGLDLPNPVGIAAGFDKHAQAIDGVLKLGCGLVEVGGVHAPAPARQPAPARVSPAGGWGGHQPLRPQQRGHGGGVPAARRAARKARHRRCQPRRQQGQLRQGGRLCDAGPASGPCRGFPDDQRLLAEHAGACATCRAKPRSMISSPAPWMRRATPPVTAIASR